MSKCPDPTITKGEFVIGHSRIRVRRRKVEVNRRNSGWVPGLVRKSGGPCPASITLMFAKWLIRELGYEIED